MEYEDWLDCVDAQADLGRRRPHMSWRHIFMWWDFKQFHLTNVTLLYAEKEDCVTRNDNDLWKDEYCKRLYPSVCLLPGLVRKYDVYYISLDVMLDGTA